MKKINAVIHGETHAVLMTHVKRIDEKARYIEIILGNAGPVQIFSDDTSSYTSRVRYRKFIGRTIHMHANVTKGHGKVITKKQYHTIFIDSGILDFI